VSSRMCHGRREEQSSSTNRNYTKEGRGEQWGRVFSTSRTGSGTKKKKGKRRSGKSTRVYDNLPRRNRVGKARGGGLVHPPKEFKGSVHPRPFEGRGPCRRALCKKKCRHRSSRHWGLAGSEKNRSQGGPFRKNGRDGGEKKV